MPANKKYLTTSLHNKIAKVSAAILGALFVSATAHMAVSQWIGDYRVGLMTFYYSLFPTWIALMIVPFLFENGWKCWFIYLLTTLVFYGIFIAGQTYHPITQ